MDYIKQTLTFAFAVQILCFGPDVTALRCYVCSAADLKQGTCKTTHPERHLVENTFMNRATGLCARRWGEKYCVISLTKGPRVNLWMKTCSTFKKSGCFESQVKGKTLTRCIHSCNTSYCNTESAVKKLKPQKVNNLSCHVCRTPALHQDVPLCEGRVPLKTCHGMSRCARIMKNGTRPVDKVFCYKYDVKPQCNRVEMEGSNHTTCVSSCITDGCDPPKATGDHLLGSVLLPITCLFLVLIVK